MMRCKRDRYAMQYRNLTRLLPNDDRFRPLFQDWGNATRTLPETYVVDQKGKVVFVHRGEMFPEDIAALTRFAAK